MIRSILAGVLLSLSLAGAVSAQEFPNRPVRLVVPFSAGGPLDIVVRVLAEKLSLRWRQPVIVDNRPGAGSLIGTATAARAAPDGYTLLATSDQTFVSNRFAYKTLPYDPDRSFEPVSLLVAADMMLLANTQSMGSKSLREVIDTAKKDNKKLFYGAWGKGSPPNLLWETASRRENGVFELIMYKGGAPAFEALMSGEVQFSVASTGSVERLAQSGRIKPLAIAASARSPLFPNVPTTTELGYPDVKFRVWHGLWAPAGTPPELVAKISKDVAEVLKSGAFQDRSATIGGFSIVGSTPQELRNTIRDDTNGMREMARAAQLEPE
ncbi:MAG: tripartite tricarboxylate transporter substrate binding protein [Burkholderiaceae bacterium]|nr:tripartite tricarboxylate transporter substrate binding protein [Desulfobacterales bacterium]MDP3137610.1 tripartite tricarboxylate transporter substrate binding protein [Burkholderiaceae bacterium]